MNPAPSIIFFSTASGAGYGLLFWLALLRPVGLVPAAPGFTVAALGLALVLITVGLISSTFHLGRPERAWRALSQWRSSWLSREGVAAVATYLPAGAFGIAVLLGWPILAALLGLLAAAGAAVTVWCTGMIYASLKPVREWHHTLVAPGYLLLAAFTGAVLLALLGSFWGGAATASVLAFATGLAALGFKRHYWQSVVDAPRGAAPTLETATGLGRIGTTRPLDPPATEQTWLLREMGFRVARKHRDRLRFATLGAFAAAPLLALLAMVAGPAAAAAAVVIAGAGVLAERWLLFAEATHSVNLFYAGTPPRT
jgi:DMSO reductase anchor subunit